MSHECPFALEFFSQAGRGADPSKGANMKADMPGRKVVKPEVEGATPRGFMRGPKGKGKGFDDDGPGLRQKDWPSFRSSVFSQGRDSLTRVTRAQALIQVHPQ